MYYKYSVKGLREYMEEIKDGQPEVYNKLNLNLGRLEARQTTATVLLAGGVVVFLGSTIMFLVDKKIIYLEHEWGEPTEEKEYKDYWLIIAGVGLVLGLSGSLFKPSDNDLRKFINEHNKLNPKHPIKIQLGYNPDSNMYLVNAGIRF